MAETQSRDSILEKTTVDDITQLYTQGHIDNAEYKSMLREKAMFENRKAFGNQGYMMALYNHIVAEGQKGFNNMKDAAQHMEDFSAEHKDVSQLQQFKDAIVLQGQQMWGVIQILNAIPSAFGEVNSLAAEKLALQNGASPGWAKLIGIGANVTSGIAPSLVGAKLTSAGIRGAAAGARALGIGAKAEEGVQAASAAAKGATQATEIAKAVEAGLAEEGITANLAGKAAQETSAVATAAPEVAKQTKYIVSESGKAIDTATGEVLTNEASRRLGVNVSQAGEIVASPAVAPRVWTGTAQKIAGDMGVPQNRVSELLTEWAPEHIGNGDIAGASQKFVEDIAKLTPEQATMLKKYTEHVYNVGSPEAAGQSLMSSLQQATSSEQGAVSIGTITAPVRNLPEIYRNILLASPVGRIKDFLSNAGATVNYMAQREVGALVGGSGETTTQGTIAYARGLTASIGEGLQAFRSAFAPGGLQGTTRFGGIVSNEMGQVVNAPTALTVGIDRFFKAINTRASLYAQEMENAILNGRAFDIANVNSPTAGMLEKAVAHADYVTYQNDLGAIGKGLMQVAGGAAKYSGGLSELYFPFLKTPINLVKYAWNNTPGLQIASGRLWSEILAGGPQADAAMGRLVLSNMFGYYVSEMAKAGMITGAGPGDPGLRAEWLKTHEPYSLRVGDTWVPLNFAQPFSHAVGMIADFTNYRPDELDTANIEKAGLAILMTVHQNIGTNSWWDEFNKMADAFNTKAESDSKVKKVEKAVEAPLVTIGTLGQPGALVKAALDPVTRDSQTLFEQWRAKMPGWSDTAPAKYDGYGDKIVPPMALLNRWGGGAVIPIKTKDISQDPMHVEGDRLQVKLPYRAPSIGGSPHELDMKNLQPGDKVGVGLSTDQVAERDQIYGNYMADKQRGIPALLENPVYQGLPDPAKKEWFEGTAHDALKFANEAIQLKHKELGIAVIQQDAKRELSNKMLTDQQRYQMQEQYANSISYIENLTPEQINNILRFTTPSTGEEEQ